MEASVYDIFNRAKRMNEDEFERDIAPTLAIDRHKRTLENAVADVERLRAQVQALLDEGEAFPEEAKLKAEMNRRFAKLKDNKKVIDQCQKLLNRWAAHLNSTQEEIKAKNEVIKSTISKLLPEVSSTLTKIELRHELEYSRLSIANGELLKENTSLKAAASASLGEERVSERLEHFLNNRLSAIMPQNDAQMTKLQSDLSDLRQDLEMKDSELERERQRATTDSNKNAQKIETLEKNKVVLENSVTELRAQLGEAVRTRDDLQRKDAHHIQEIEDLSLRIATQDSLITAAEQKADETSQQAEKAKEELKAERDALQKRIAQLEAERLTANTQTESFQGYSSSVDAQSIFAPRGPAPQQGLGASYGGQDMRGTLSNPVPPRVAPGNTFTQGYVPPVSSPQGTGPQHGDNRFQGHRSSGMWGMMVNPNQQSLGQNHSLSPNTPYQPSGVNPRIEMAEGRHMQTIDGPLRAQFLINGLLRDDLLTLQVSPSLIAKLVEQIIRWNGQARKGPWFGGSPNSSTRCVDTRRSSVHRNLVPDARLDVEVVACTRCVTKKQLCIFIDSRGPIIVPLPLTERSRGATPMVGEYYVKN